MNVKETAKLIMVAATIEAVNLIAENDPRDTVVKAAEKRIKQLSGGADSDKGEAPLIDCQYDAKNRAVTLALTGKVFTVEKPDTGYSETFEREDLANDAFNHQIGCTHN